MRYGKLQANLSGQSSESGNLATLTLSITSTVRRPNFQTPVLSQGATIRANVSDMVNLESVEHPQQHFMKINFLAFLVILASIWLSYNSVGEGLFLSLLTERLALQDLGPPLGDDGARRRGRRDEPRRLKRLALNHI